MNTKWYASYTWAWLLAFLLQVAMVQAQTISGTVQASDGSPLIGASVIVKGTPRGVLTDGEGKFTLQASQGDILSISYIGYETQEVTVGTEDNISVSMVEADNTLSEVVVVGYGTQRREDLTGAIGSVNVDELADVPLVSVEQGIQGRVAGVNVTQGTGAPGGPMRVQIRGVGTTGDTEPLYVIDGYPVTVGSQGDLGTSPLTTLNPNDIESIDVLKDASAAAIYGARAANGVVIITTKRGKAGAVKVDFSAKAGVQTPWRRLDLLGEKDYVEYVVEKYANDPNTTVDDIPANLRDPNNLPGNNTDWQDELFRTAPMQDYNASITGGNENASFNLGLGYFDQQGTMLGTYFKRLSIKLNSDYKINKRIRVGESVLVSQTEKRVEGNLGGRRQLEHLVKQAASVPVFDESFQGGYGAPVTDDGQDARNPVMVADLYENIPRQYRVLGTLYGEVDILDGLTYRINLGVDVFIGRGYNYNPVYEGTRRLLIQSNFSENYGLTVNPLIEHTLNFNRSFGDHNLGLLIGVTDQSFNNRSISGSVIDLPNNTVRSLSAGQNPTLSGFLFESRLRSQLARLTYGYADKYLLTANVRRDGSSRLNPDNRYDIFPSASLGWRVSKESFMESVSFVSDLKLRASYGIIGNDKTAPIYNTLNLDNVFNYNFNGVLANGVTQGSLINPDLRWEISEQTNFGADIGLWENKLLLNVDYFIKNTNDWIVPVPVPPSIGLGSAPLNAGNIQNRGWEFGLNYRKLTGDFTYDIRANVSTLTNEVISLGAGQPIAGGNTFSLGFLTRTAEGGPVGSYYGFVTDGIFQTQAEIDAANGLDGDESTAYQAGASPGDIRFKDIAGPTDENGNPTGPDGQITDADRMIIGNPIPDLIYGLTANLGYGNFDLSMNLQGVQGNEVWNALRTWTEGMSQNFNQGAEVLERWTGPNTSTTVPRAVNGDPNNNKRNSDRFVEDGSFMRIKNLTIGYSLPSTVTDAASWLRSTRIYVTSNNLLTITNYTGFDPEIGGGSATVARGIDLGSYPQARTFLIGVQLGF